MEERYREPSVHRSITIVRILYRASQTYTLYQKHFCTILALDISIRYFLRRHTCEILSPRYYVTVEVLIAGLNDVRLFL